MLCLQEARNEHQSYEKRIALLTGQLEETKAQLEAAERAYKSAHSELAEVIERVNELTTANGSLQSAKRKVETDLQAVQVMMENTPDRT